MAIKPRFAIIDGEKLLVVDKASIDQLIKNIIVAGNITPDADDSRLLGSSTKRWARAYINWLVADVFFKHLIPDGDGTLDIGTSAKEWRHLYLDGVANIDCLRVQVVTKTGAYTATDDDIVILVDATAGAITITLPAASGRSGQVYIIKKIDSSANAVTVDANASETIDGALTYSLASQYDVVRIVCDGANWHVI